MTPELIRDHHLIVGILDSDLSEIDLSLEKAKEMVRQNKATGIKEFSSVNELGSRQGKYPAT